MALDPMREAIKHRRAHGLDLSKILDPSPNNLDDAKLEGTPGPFRPNGFEKDDGDHSIDETKGDLAPEGQAQRDSENDSIAHAAEHGDRSPAQRKAIHASEDHRLEKNLAHNDMQNPEHEPIPRGGELAQNQFGHEVSQDGEDGDHEVDSLMIGDGKLEDLARPPRTLTARIRANLIRSKK